MVSPCRCDCATRSGPLDVAARPRACIDAVGPRRRGSRLLSQAMDSNPNYLRGKAWLAAAEALAGDIPRAELHLAEYVAVERDMTVGRFARERSSVPLDAVSPAFWRENERILEGLRRAGMPDGVDGRPSRRPGTETAQLEVSRGSARAFSEPVSELIGREAELSQVTDLMRKHRLVTLTGEGGSARRISASRSRAIFCRNFPMGPGSSSSRRFPIPSLSRSPLRRRSGSNSPRALCPPNVSRMRSTGSS